MDVRTNIHAGQLDFQQMRALRQLAGQLTTAQFNDLFSQVCKLKPNELPLLLTQVASGGAGLIQVDRRP
jgi:hypothetical protein